MIKVYSGHISLVQEPEVFIELLEKVNEERKDKVLNLKKTKDRQRSLLAGVLLKQALEKEGLDYSQVKIATTPEGKPYLPELPNLHFSLSHSGEYVVCAISDKPVGVDIEGVDRGIFAPEKKEKMLSLVDKCLCPSEMETFASCPKEEIKELFLKYWTRKEAYSKAIGKGIGMDFSAIDTESDMAYFKSEWLKEGYMLSICMMN